jgi:hypothetical protein
MLCLSCYVKSPKQQLNFTKKSRNKHRLLHFKGVLYHVHTYTTYSSYHLFYMNQVPEKQYFGQWPYITNKIPINAIWHFKWKKCKINCYRVSKYIINISKRCWIFFQWIYSIFVYHLHVKCHIVYCVLNSLKNTVLHKSYFCTLSHS